MVKEGYCQSKQHSIKYLGIYLGSKPGWAYIPAQNLKFLKFSDMQYPYMYEDYNTFLLDDFDR